MSMKYRMEELERVNDALKQYRSKIRELNRKKREIEADINEYCIKKDIPGVKYTSHRGLIAFRVETKRVHSRKPVKTQLEDVVETLKRNGIKKSPERVAKEIFDAKKGKEVEVFRIKKMKNQNR